MGTGVVYQVPAVGIMPATTEVEDELLEVPVVVGIGVGLNVDSYAGIVQIKAGGMMLCTGKTI